MLGLTRKIRVNRLVKDSTDLMLVESFIGSMKATPYIAQGQKKVIFDKMIIKVIVDINN